MALIREAECKDCTGFDNCTKYCAKKAGLVLATFMLGIDTVKTEIGDIRKPTHHNEPSLIVTGHQIDCDVPSYILRQLTSNIKINSSNKFKQFMGKNINSVLKSYVDLLTPESYNDKISEINNLIKGFNTNKVMALPIKLNTNVKISVPEQKTKETRVDGKVSSISWRANKETGKIEGVITVRFDNPMMGTKYSNVPFTEYGSRLVVKELVEYLKTSEVQGEFLNMTNEGFIKPIVITDGKYTFALDCKNMYLVSENNTTIIGTWGNKAITEFNVSTELKKSKAYEKLMSAIRYIELHKRFIAPYGLVDENKIQL